MTIEELQRKWDADIEYFTEKVYKYDKLEQHHKKKMRVAEYMKNTALSKIEKIFDEQARTHQ